MAFIDKLGQVAGKVGELAGDTFDYGKAKGKVVLEKGKVKDAKEALGDYVHSTLKAGGTLEQYKLDELCKEIDVHIAEIEKLEAEAKQSGADISGAFKSDEASSEGEDAE